MTKLVYYEVDETLEVKSMVADVIVAEAGVFLSVKNEEHQLYVPHDRLLGILPVE